MANLTLAEARTKTGQFLDDAANARWTSAQVDDALTDAISACLTDYSDAGGDRFDLETTGTTSASDGSLSIVSVLPLVIKQVAIVVSPTSWRIKQRDPLRRGDADLTARSLRILYIREYALPSNSAHPLIGVSSTEANSWRAFDKWVCAEAAWQLGAKDLEQGRRAWLAEMKAEARATALKRPSSPSSYPIPRPEYSPFDDLAWQVVMPSTLYLTRTGA